MLSETVEPECRQRQRINLSRNTGAVGEPNPTTPVSAAILATADDAPGLEATKAVAHATIHAAVNGAATDGRELFVTAAQAGLGAHGATDRANSIAVN
jgi:hypothetical protein